MSETFCLNCGDFQPYRTKSKGVQDVFRGVRFTWVETTAICAICGDEVYAAEVNDLNCKNREFNFKRYAKAGGKTCGNCQKYLGGGDWNLCCRIKYDLVYEYSPACDEYEEKNSENN